MKSLIDQPLEDGEIAIDLEADIPTPRYNAEAYRRKMDAQILQESKAARGGVVAWKAKLEPIRPKPTGSLRRKLEVLLKRPINNQLDDKDPITQRSKYNP
jgi:hypothetical protein